MSDLRLRRTLVEKMQAHARAAAPEECCGLLGGHAGEAASVYQLRNVSDAPTVAYDVAPEELFNAQRLMRERGETLVAVYHSHPRSAEPAPSTTDVRLAFYPSAIYFIIGFDAAGECVLRAFRIFEREGRWESATFEVNE
jgi:proteasome lid subunit RPN8/RPN11